MGREPDRDANLGAHIDANRDASPVTRSPPCDDDERLATQLARRLQAGTRGLVWITTDEARALELAERVGPTLGWPIRTWSAATGIDHDGHPRALAVVLAELLADDARALWVVFDGSAVLTEPAALRALRELAQRDDGPAVLLIEPTASPALAAIPELSIDALPPPTEGALGEQLTAAAAALALGAYPDANERLVPHRDAIARAGSGLPQWAFDRLLAEALVLHGSDPDAIVTHLGAAKPALLDRTGLLEVTAPAPAAELGGLSQYKQWLARRARSLSPEAAAAGIPAPRGVLLLGVQGCGKSLAAQASAAILGLPLVRLEPGRLFGGTLGESEANLRRVTALVERLAPIVLWIDEIDKGFAGASASAADGGTTARVIGSLLTWLEQRSRPVFVAATANRVDALPPELLRRGRLDEIFFVDLPGPDERAAILDVHLTIAPQRTLGRPPAFQGAVDGFHALARDADGFSGAELAAALTEARLAAFVQERPLAAADFREALKTTVPLSRTRAESIEALRTWAKGRARVA